MILDFSSADRRWIVSVFDPALDSEKSEVVAYIQAGHPANWQEYLACRPGIEPVLWQVRPLDHDARCACRSGHEGYRSDGTLWRDVESQHLVALRRSVTGWSHLRERRGEKLVEVGPSFVGEPGAEILQRELVMRLSRVIQPIIQELGALALRASVITETEKN
jgi:hypothetical protein